MDFTLNVLLNTNNNNNRGERKLWEVMDMSMVLIVIAAA